MASRPLLCYFNPRLREGGDMVPCCCTLCCTISIHASAREATHITIKNLLKPTFQSTPPRGRRLISPVAHSLSARFQSTPPRGRRPPTIFIAGNYVISIHASAREATVPRIIVAIHSPHFNPRLREGGDCINYQFLHLIQSIPCIDHPSGTSN